MTQGISISSIDITVGMDEIKKMASDAARDILGDVAIEGVQVVEFDDEYVVFSCNLKGADLELTEETLVEDEGFRATDFSTALGQAVAKVEDYVQESQDSRTEVLIDDGS